MNSKNLKTLVLALVILTLGISALLAMEPVAAKVARVEAKLVSCQAASRTPTVDPSAFLSGACRAGSGGPVCQR